MPQILWVEALGVSVSLPSDHDAGHRGYLFAGFASLFVAAFIDNARGPVLPVLCAQLNIPYETAGLFLMIGNVAAVLMTFALGRLLPRIGDRKAAIITCWLAVLPGLLAPFISGRTSLLSLGLMLGASVSLVGSLSSVLTVRGSPVQARGRYVAMQQVMYGIGSLIAPLLFSALTHAEKPWWWLFTGSSLVTLVLGFSYYKILPPEVIEPRAAATASHETRWNRAAVLMLFVFSFYVAGEVLASMWMNTLMVGQQNFKPEVAAQYQMGFFLMIGLTRFLCFLLVRPRYETLVLVGCLTLGALFGILGQRGHSWALPLMGIVGPFFPLTMARISIKFPSTWKRMMMNVYVCIQLMLALMHISVGRVADTLGIGTAFLLAPAFLLLALVLMIPLLKPQPRDLPA
jgi:MFS family permease